MKPPLFLITHQFPFGNTETFLESEAPILSECFDLVFVPSKTNGVARALPENAKIDLRLSHRFESRGRKLRSLFSLRFWEALYTDRKKHRFKPRAVRRIASFISDAKAAESWALEALGGAGGQPRLVYTYWLTGKTHGIIWAKEKIQLCAVSRTHRFDLYDDRFDPAFWPLRQKTLNKVDKLFVISQDGVQYLKRNYEISNNVTISRLGAIDPGVQCKRSIDTVLRLVSVSSFLPQKRVPMIAEMIVRFASEHPKTRMEWTHFGDGPGRGCVLDYLSKNRKENLKTSFPGSIPNEDLLNFYRSAPVDLFVNLSDSEGIPVSIMEAQACGIPVLATQVGGVAEIVNEETGFLVPEDVTYNQFKQKVLGLLTGQSSREQLAITRFFRNNYDASRNYTDFREQLLHLLEEASFDGP